MISPNDSNPNDSEQPITDVLPARMLNEFCYCPRLFYLEHVEGLFAHNADTVEGAQRHKRVDGKADELPAGELAQETKLHARSVTLSSELYGITAKLDLVETQGQIATPVDYKRGKPKKLDDGSLGAWDPERVQMCVQALVLREHGYECIEAILYFFETKQRITIPIDADLLELTLTTIREAQQTITERRMPPPLVDSPKCPRCSLVSICLPDETTRCAQADGACMTPKPQMFLFDVGPRFGFDCETSEETDRPLRQLITARDERKPLYLNTQGYSVGISSQVLKVKDKSKVVQQVRLNDVNQINLFGAVQVSTQAIQAMLAADVPLIYYSFGGWFHGMTQPIGLKNIIWRREQFRMADRADFCLALAKSLVSGKIRNCRTLLMRNHVAPPLKTLQFMKAINFEVSRAGSLGELLGLEGVAARTYFEQFAGMIKVHGEEDVFGCEAEDSQFAFDFSRRNRRPPRDPVNALLSLGYSLLAKDLTIACAATGLDPYLGFYHQPRFGRPALSLDLMEPFRPLIVDSAVLSAINQKMVTSKDFVAAGNSVALTAAGRKGFFRAYETRMDQLVTHPLFGYRVSYRRLLEIQVRLLARVLLGEIREYPTFVTR